MPLLLRGLDLPDNEIRASVIDTLHAAAVSSSGEKDNAIVAEHASSLVSTMLRNCLVSQMPSVVGLVVCGELKEAHSCPTTAGPCSGAALPGRPPKRSTV